MVVLNDVGLTTEIIGFIIFLFVPIQETYNLTLNKTSKTHEFFNKHHKIRYGLRYSGISLIILGLIMQFGFLN